ncbi:uncharacterized protein si:dkeyp-51f12.2 [Syngnathus typhle]|uniref:uncharacterized protein si:dkeyp-51f12.2 n=1 Tax=Syngnathus typhle TaxID=161592 RepID=UPI002A6AD7AA|nr:uncharacterized protein si:dkeyp-51f12.2 [Syngnathus typhle]
MPSLHHGAIFIGAFLIVTGGSTAFLASSQSRLQPFSLCCVVLGVVMLILGLFWAMNSKGTSNYDQQEFDPDCPHYPYNEYAGYSSHALFAHDATRFPESQLGFMPGGNTALLYVWINFKTAFFKIFISNNFVPRSEPQNDEAVKEDNEAFVVFPSRTLDSHRQGTRSEDFDYPPMDHGGFSPSPHPPPWLGPPPPYEVAIKTTCSSTHLRRAYSDTHLAAEPLFGRSREISFEV